MSEPSDEARALVEALKAELIGERSSQFTIISCRGAALRRGKTAIALRSRQISACQHTPVETVLYEAEP